MARIGAPRASATSPPVHGPRTDPHGPAIGLMKLPGKHALDHFWWLSAAVQGGEFGSCWVRARFVSPLPYLWPGFLSFTCNIYSLSPSFPHSPPPPYLHSTSPFCPDIVSWLASLALPCCLEIQTQTTRPRLRVDSTRSTPPSATEIQPTTRIIKDTRAEVTRAEVTQTLLEIW